MTQQTCKERINQHYAERMEDLRLLWAGLCGEDCPKCGGDGDLGGEVNGSPIDCDYCSGTGKLSEEIPDLGSLYDYGLSFDYIAPHTFKDQERGYFRYRLSWGGPSDEFRIYAEQISKYAWHVDRIEYWFLDWFDGAHRVLMGHDLSFMADLFESIFVDTGTADHEHTEAMKDYEPKYDDDDEESDED